VDLINQAPTENIKEVVMRKITAQSIVIGLLLFYVGLGTTFGEEKIFRLLDKKTHMEMESIRSPNISPDGKHIIFTRGWIDKKNDRSRSNLWIVDSEGKRVRELTHGNWRDFFLKGMKQHRFM
jgi:tricorn protease-like protein